MSEERIIDLVFARADLGGCRRIAAALLGALTFYSTGIVLLMGSECFLSEWSQALVRRIDDALESKHVVEHFVPTPRPLPAQPPPLPSRVPAAAVRRTPARSAASRSFAQAGAIIARDPDPSEALDLTGNAFVTGMGAVYSGGLTRSDGVSREAVHDLPAPPVPDRSAPVGLPDPAWSCPWPLEAESEAVNEQSAIVRVTVNADGSVVGAMVLFDPGYGFGEAARRCALQSRFHPARDRDGRAIHAVSPPIKVRFLR